MVGPILNFYWRRIEEVSKWKMENCVAGKIFLSYNFCDHIILVRIFSQEQSKNCEK